MESYRASPFVMKFSSALVPDVDFSIPWTVPSAVPTSDDTVSECLPEILSDETYSSLTVAGREEGAVEGLLSPSTPHKSATAGTDH